MGDHESRPESAYLAALAAVRPGDPATKLLAAAGPSWKRPTLTGYVFPDGVGAAFNARVAKDGRVGEIGFGRDFPQQYDIDGLHIGMSFAEVQRARPNLRFSADIEMPDPALAMQEYAETLPTGIESFARFRSGSLIYIGFTLPGAAYVEDGEFVPAARGFYPAPQSQPDAPFGDTNTKLAVLGALLETGAIDLGSEEMLAMHVHGRVVDLEHDGYELDREVYAYLARYPLSPALLASIDRVAPAASDAIYRYPFYHFEGETDEFTIPGLAGFAACPNVRAFEDYGMVANIDLADLAAFPNLESVSLDYGTYDNPDALLALPKLASLTCFETIDPTLLDALRTRGVSVKIRS